MGNTFQSSGNDTAAIDYYNYALVLKPSYREVHDISCLLAECEVYCIVVSLYA